MKKVCIIFKRGQQEVRVTDDAAVVVSHSKVTGRTIMWIYGLPYVIFNAPLRTWTVEPC